MNKLMTLGAGAALALGLGVGDALAGDRGGPVGGFDIETDGEVSVFMANFICGVKTLPVRIFTDLE